MSVATSSLEQIAVETIGQGRGKRTARRVTSTTPLNVETSFEMLTQILGLNGLYIGTYNATTKSDGSLFGEGEGIFSSYQGDMATWKGLGTGTFSADGGVRYRGTLSFTTTSPKLAALNAVPVLFDFSVDADGNTEAQFYAWK